MSADFGSFVPIWGWHPAVVALFVFAVDFGAIMAIRIFIERQFYWTRWWSFRVGDTIGLPLYAGFATVVVGNHEYHAFFTQVWWHVLLIAIGYMIAVSNQLNGLRTGFFTVKDLLIPSEAYHTLVFGFMFYLATSLFLPVASWGSPTWAVAMAFLGLAIYVVSWVIDQTPLVSKAPEREVRYL